MHGIKFNLLTTGSRPLLAAALSVIGLIATAQDADAVAFPLNKPVLVTDIRDAIGKAGTQGTLVHALTEISNQCSPVLVVVRVAPGVAAGELTAEEATDINVIGGYAGGVYTGMQALLAAQAQLSVTPRIIGAPGLDSQAVAIALEVVAKKLRGFTYTSCGDADTVAEAATYRDNFSAREHMLIYPDFSGGFAGKAVAIALGTRARLDNEVGFHKTISNVAVAGVTGLSRDVFFDMLSGDTDAGVLNTADVTTLIQMQGFRFWGNRTTSDDPMFAFESVVRTDQVIQDRIAANSAWAVDQPINRNLVRDIMEMISADFAVLRSGGYIVGAEITFDQSANTPATLSSGRLAFDYEFTACAPAEEIGFSRRITNRFYVNLASSSPA